MILSVCIPAFQAERYIREALESVLAEVPDDAEIVVVDDGSTDGTFAVAASCGNRIRVLRQPHRGIGATFNAAVSASSGELIATIDADDLWLPGKTDAQLHELHADPSLDAVLGYAREFLSPDLPAEASTRWACRSSPVPGFLRSTMIVRRSAWHRVGPFDTDLAVGEFVAWYARAVAAGLRTKVLPQVVLARRIHGANTVLRERDARADYLKIVTAALHRRRAATVPDSPSP